MNYGELKSNVAAYMKRSDLTGVIPTFLTLAEADIYRDVRVRAMEQVQGFTLAGEVQPHPDRLIAARKLTVGDFQYVYVTPEEYEIAQSDDKVFTSIGQSFYIKGGEAGDTGSLVYTAMLAPLVGDTDTNWLTDNAPELYLFGALRHAHIYTLDDAGVAKYAQLYAGVVDRINKLERNQGAAGPLWARTVGGYQP